MPENYIYIYIYYIYIYFYFSLIMEWNPCHYFHLCTRSRLGQRSNELVKTSLSKFLNFTIYFLGNYRTLTEANFNLLNFTFSPAARGSERGRDLARASGRVHRRSPLTRHLDLL